MKAIRRNCLKWGVIIIISTCSLMTNASCLERWRRLDLDVCSISLSRAWHSWSLVSVSTSARRHVTSSSSSLVRSDPADPSSSELRSFLGPLETPRGSEDTGPGFCRHNWAFHICFNSDTLCFIAFNSFLVSLFSAFIRWASSSRRTVLRSASISPFKAWLLSNSLHLFFKISFSLLLSLICFSASSLAR